MIVWFSLNQFEQLCFDMAVAVASRWTATEPIPPFSTRDPGILESCLAAPLQTFDEKDLYPSLIEKATMLFYLLNKNHPFKNGNKRVALTALLVLLYRNRRWMVATDDEMYAFSIYVASSDARNKERVVRTIQTFINARMCTIRQIDKYVYRRLEKWTFPKRRGKKWKGYPRRSYITFPVSGVPVEEPLSP